MYLYLHIICADAETFSQYPLVCVCGTMPLLYTKPSRDAYNCSLCNAALTVHTCRRANYVMFGCKYVEVRDPCMGISTHPYSL